MFLKFTHSIRSYNFSTNVALGVKRKRDVGCQGCELLKLKLPQSHKLAIKHATVNDLEKDKKTRMKWNQCGRGLIYQLTPNCKREQP